MQEKNMGHIYPIGRSKFILIEVEGGWGKTTIPESLALLLILYINN